jgi:tetratricopeptide (TPR) repeat protein
MRGAGLCAIAILAGIPTLCAPQKHFDAEAIQLNNRGVALMGQQFTERAAESFAEAFKKDPTLAQAAVNEGIALLSEQKLDQAKEWFQKAIGVMSSRMRWPAFKRR